MYAHKGLSYACTVQTKLDFITLAIRFPLDYDPGLVYTGWLKCNVQMKGVIAVWGTSVIDTNTCFIYNAIE